MVMIGCFFEVFGRKLGVTVSMSAFPGGDAWCNG